MPTTYAIPNGSTAFAATLYTGNASTQTINNTVNGVSFQPDLVWTKSRTGAYSHQWFDSVRGINAFIGSNNTAAEVVGTAQLTSFNSNGFTLGANENSNYTNGYAAVGWQWKANGAAVTNTAGSITSQVSANTAAGFSVVTYTGNGSAGATVGHGLGVAPSMVILKVRNSAQDWIVGSVGMTSWAYAMRLNTTAAQNNTFNYWNSTTPSSTVVTLGDTGGVNSNGLTYVAYCFAAVPGYSAFGKYTGDGISTNGPFVYTGFRPRWVMFKKTNSGSNWSIVDTSRDLTNVAAKNLKANSAAAEVTATSSAEANLDILSNGFKLRGDSGDINDPGATYIYAAFAEMPFAYANAR
jgi:hypothetical protein